MNVSISSIARARSAAIAIALVGGLTSLEARADCAQDLGGLMNRRAAAIAAINVITKSHGGKLEPISGCPKLRSLAAIEGEVVSYMAKNKDWCSLPDDLVGKMTESRARTAGVAVKACDFAVKLKKMQEQQAVAATQQQQQQQQQAIKLPTGPL